MPHIAVRFAAFLLAAVFAWAGVAKLVRWSNWREGLRRYRFGPLELPLAAVVPVSELAVVAGLVAGLTRASAALTLGMLAGFSGAVVRARTFEGDQLPCNCFGRSPAHDYRTLLVRNGLLGVPATAILIAGEDFYLFGATPWPSTAEAVPVTLVGLGLLLGGWMVRAISTLSSGGGGD
jgi:hypothetical protein